VFAALRNAMTVLGQAVIFRAVLSAGVHEAVKMLLLTERQTCRINDSIQGCRLGA